MEPDVDKARPAEPADKAVAEPAVPSDPPREEATEGEGGRLAAEAKELGVLLKDAPLLGFLKPRLAQLAGDGLDYAPLLSLYRIVARTFKEDLEKRTQSQRVLEEEQQKLNARVESMKKEIAGLVASAKVAAATQKMEAELAPGLKVELEKKDKELERKDKEVKDASERLESMQKDFSNFRNRVKMDVDLSVNRAREEWLRKVLGVADNFERALSASRDPKAIEALLKGIEMIQAQLMDILEAEGVKEIPTEGQPFDPRLHDALQQEVTAEHPDDTVLKALQKGYTINGKVLRPAMVQTSRLPPGVTYQPPGPNGKPKTAEVETRNEKPASADAADKLAPVEKVEKLVETPKMAEKPAANAPVEEVKVAVPEPSVLPADLLEQLPLAEEPAVETTPKPVVEPGEAELEDWFAHRLSNS